MRRIPAHFILLCLIGLLPPRAVSGAPPLQEQPIAQLEQRLTEIDSTLEQLAGFTLRGGTGAVGYRSKPQPDPAKKEWIRIEWAEEALIDQVVLVPALYRESQVGILAEGFPQAFRILAGTAHTTNTVAVYTTEDRLLPRIAPLAVSFQPVSASWVRIEATRLSPRIMDNKYLLQLAEIMVFNERENVALHQTATTSSIEQGPFLRRYLTDGFTPYLMDSARGERSQTQFIRVKNTIPPPTLTMDLKTPVPINQINLHAADTALSIPMQNFSNQAAPRQVRITGAVHPDFSDETFLCECQRNSHPAVRRPAGDSTHRFR